MAVDSVGNVKEEMVETKSQLRATLSALNELASEKGDLEKQYKALSKQMDKLRSQLRTVRFRSNDMERRRDIYIHTWRYELQHVSNPEIRKLSREGRDRAREMFDRIGFAIQEIQQVGLPFHSDLHGLHKHLGNALNTGAVQRAMPLINKLRTQGHGVTVKIDIAIVELDYVIKAMATKK